MSVRYTCPNDGEVLSIDLDPSVTPPAESYICRYCRYKSTKTNAQAKLTAVDETYIPPSKKKGK